MHLTTEWLDFSPGMSGEAQAFADYRRVPDVASYQSWNTGFSLADAEALIAGSRYRVFLPPGSGCSIVNGHSELPVGGQQNCPLVATETARSWPTDLPTRGLVALAMMQRCWVSSSG